MLGTGLCDCSCGRPSSIRMGKRLGGRRRLLRPAARSLCRRCTVSSLFSVLGHSLDTVIIRGLEARGRSNHSALPVKSERHPRYLKTHSSSGSVNLGSPFAANPPILGLLYLGTYCVGRPGLAQFMRTELD